MDDGWLHAGSRISIRCKPHRFEFLIDGTIEFIVFSYMQANDLYFTLIRVRAKMRAGEALKIAEDAA